MAKQLDLKAPVQDSWEMEQKLRESGDPAWMSMRSRLCAIGDFSKSLTEQSHKDSCDINVLMARYERSGELPVDEQGQAYYGDFSSVPDPFAAREALQQAEESFMQLPANVRSRFYNDPLKMLEFVSDSKNKDEAVRLGMLKDVSGASVPVSAPAAPPVAESKG